MPCCWVWGCEEGMPSHLPGGTPFFFRPVPLVLKCCPFKEKILVHPPLSLAQFNSNVLFIFCTILSPLILSPLNPLFSFTLLCGWRFFKCSAWASPPPPPVLPAVRSGALSKVKRATPCFRSSTAFYTASDLPFFVSCRVVRSLLRFTCFMGCSSFFPCLEHRSVPGPVFHAPFNAV